MKRWEYKSVTQKIEGFWSRKVNHAEATALLNEHGEQGWELVSCFDVNEGHGISTSIVFIFKREKA